MALTRRQRDVLEVIRTFIARHGYSPSLEEIGRALGLSSVATVHKHVSHLVDKGLVRRVWNQNRSIDLIEEPREAEGPAALPLLGTIAAGSPLEAVRAEGDLRPHRHGSRARPPGLRAPGPRDSMIDSRSATAIWW
jgi:repressor LexA